MRSTELIPLVDLIVESKDGEWGQGEAFADSVEMLAIRGTDFEKIRVGSVEGIPKRFIQQRTAKRKRLQANDIVIEVAGGTATQPTGRVVLISEEFLAQHPGTQFTCASFSRFIRLDPKKADPVFVYWYLQYLYDSRALAMFHTQHTGVARFQWTVFSNYKLLSLPNPLEQQRIGRILNSFGDLIAANANRQRLLESLAQQLYREWFVRYRFPGHLHTPIVNGLPMSWELKKLGKVLELAYGKALKDEERVPGPFPVYGSSGVVGSHKKALVEGPGIIVGRKGNVGSVFWSFEGFFPIDTVYFVRSSISLYYLFFNLKQQNFINGDSAVPGLSRSQAYANDVVVPPPHLLEEFNRIVTPIFVQLQTLSDNNSQLRRTRDALLPRLLSGQLNVQAAELVLAE